MPTIDPSLYFRNDDHRSWINRYPVWMATLGEIPTGRYLVPDHHPSLAMINDGSLRCISNICSHKKATIMQGRGDIGSVISCPIHRWTWDLEGRIKGARGFDRDCSMDLKQTEIHGWKGHVFAGGKEWLSDIDRIGDLSRYLDASLYERHDRSSITYSFSWRIFMEIFLDLYHVRSFHPGLGSLTDCQTFDWIFGKNWSCQTGRFGRGIVRDLAYQELYDLYKESGHYDSAEYGAIWLGIYPNTMIEYYPGCLVVSTVWPNGASSCTNHLDFYYEKGLLERFPRFAEVQQRCFMATADEDEVIGNRMQQGLSWLSSPFESFDHPLEEAGYKHFHEWLGSSMDASP